MSAFDPLAPTYDADFTQQPIGQLLRARVHQRLLTHFANGNEVLEIGCGTGEDALFLAQHGIHVTATDASEKMLSVARAKTRHQPDITFETFDLKDMTRYIPTDSNYDGVFSNFGALNCIDDWRPLAEYLSIAIKPGGKACFGIMAPYCVWEFVWHIGHFKSDIALRRLRGDNFGDLRITYPTVKRITDDFSPYFKRINVFPLGLFLPTSALFDVVQKHPALMRVLVALEERFESISALAMFADHYWIELERIELS